MDLFTVSFFGHRIVPEFREAEERVESLIHTLLLEKEYVEFLVGRNGDFEPADGGSKRPCGILCGSFQRRSISNSALRPEKEKRNPESRTL